jgi:hypothetical protein
VDGGREAGIVKRRKARIIKEPKARGEWGESVFMVRVEQGLPVSRPWGDSNSFDFVVGKPGRFVSVQVKSTTVKNGGWYVCRAPAQCEVCARSVRFRGSLRHSGRCVVHIPAKKLAGRGYVTLCPNSGGANFEEYREAWHLLRQATGMEEETAATHPEESAA